MARARRARPIPYNNTRQGFLRNLVAGPSGYLVVSTPGAELRSKYITVNEQGAYQLERFGYVTPPAQLKIDSQGSLFATRGQHHQAQHCVRCVSHDGRGQAPHPTLRRPRIGLQPGFVGLRG